MGTADDVGCSGKAEVDADDNSSFFRVSVDSGEGTTCGRMELPPTVYGVCGGGRAGMNDTAPNGGNSSCCRSSHS